MHLMLLLTLLAQAPPTEADDSRFRVEKVAAGVYAVLRQEPPSLIFEPNNVFIINDDDVIVVDTNFTPGSARATLAELRKLTDKPVRYVINTHWHDDHITGNQVYRDAYPGVEFVAHRTALDDMPAVGATNRKQLHEGAAAFADALRARVAKNDSMLGGELTPDERAAYLSDVRHLDGYVAEMDGIRIVAPTVIVDERLTIYRGSRTIDILHLGAGHTRADLVVHLPTDNIVIAGDLVVWPVPLVGSTSYPAAFAVTLQRLLELQPAMIIPGHGPILRDDAYVQQLVRLMTSIRDQTQAAVAKGLTLEETRKAVDLQEFVDLFAGDSRMRRFIFQSYVAHPGVAAAYAQSKR